LAKQTINDLKISVKVYSERINIVICGSSKAYKAKMMHNYYHHIDSLLKFWFGEAQIEKIWRNFCDVFRWRNGDNFTEITS